MNWNAQMLPGITVLLAGAFLGYFSGRLTRKKQNAEKLKMLGVALAAAGAILVFFPV